MKILVPPGIGDGYWVLVKLRGFLESQGIMMPEVWIHDNGGPRRADDMWSRVPFVKFGGFATFTASKPLLVGRRGRLRPRFNGSPTLFDLAYRNTHHAVQKDVEGYDYFLSFNGDLDHGRSLDEAMPDAPTNWYEPLIRTPDEIAKKDDYRKRFGRYVVTAFWDQGFYKKFLSDFGGEPQIVKMLRTLASAGLTVLVVGASWDKDGIGRRLTEDDPRFINLIGETSFADLAALLEGAAGVLGFPAGNTLLGPYFHTPTVLIWGKHFSPNMWTNSVPPDAAYFAVDSLGADPKTVAKLLLDLVIDKGKVVPEHVPTYV
jgi:hypothetical protein